MPEDIVLNKGFTQRVVNKENNPYIIAEIGSNHNQDIGLAKELIHISADCGADAVKFQSLNLRKQYAPSEHSQDLIDLFKQIELDERWYQTLSDEARKAGVAFCSSPTYIEAISLLEAIRVPFYKLASPQVRTFPSLVKKVAACKKPLIISVGYCNYTQIETAINICYSQGNEQIVLLHCVSEYPASYEKVNLNSMVTLGKMFECLVGISDHTPAFEVPCAAVALGAVLIEKHITLDRTLPGPDHNFALEPDEFKRMVTAVKNVHAAMGSHRKRVTLHENNFAQKLLVRWFAKNDIASGELIGEDNVFWLRSMEGISDENFGLLGKIMATRDIRKGSPIKWEDIKRVE